MAKILTILLHFYFRDCWLYVIMILFNLDQKERSDTTFETDNLNALKNSFTNLKKRKNDK